VGVAVVLVSHATNGAFNAGNVAGFSNNQSTRVWCRINAVAAREGFGARSNGIGELAFAQSHLDRVQ
jgi:hypothetical protein